MKESVDLVHVLLWIVGANKIQRIQEIVARDGKWRDGSVRFLTDSGYRLIETFMMGGWVKTTQLNKALKEIYKEYGTERGEDQVIELNDTVIQDLTTILEKAAIKAIREIVKGLNKESKERLYDFVKIANTDNNSESRDKALLRYTASVMKEYTKEEHRVYSLIRKLGTILDKKEFRFVLGKIS